MNATEAVLIMVRAKITRNEWERLRILGVKRNEPTSTIVGELIRDYVDLHDPQPLPKGEAK